MTKFNFKDLKYRISKEDYAIIKSKRTYPDAFANVIDNSEITVIIEEYKIEKHDIIKIESDWKIISFDSDIDLSIVGFLAKISDALAKEDISIFVLSFYSTIHILIKRDKISRAINALEKLGIKQQ